MISLTSGGTELRRFRHGTMPKIAVATMLLIPLLYGALYLWAFWDPTGHLDKLPVALVNSDQSAQVKGKTVHAGTDVAARLLSSKDLDWVVATPRDAAKGVSDGTYYFALTIPRDFSARIASAGGSHPAAAELKVNYNDANSFLATTLGRQAMGQVRTAVSETVSEKAVDSVLVGLGSAQKGFAQTSDGAVTLRSASGQLADGARKGADGAATLASGAASAANGSAAVAKGAAGLTDGATKAAAGAAALSTGAASAANGSAAVAKGASGLTHGATTAAAGAATLASGAASAANGSAAIAKGAAGLTHGATTAAAGAAALSTGAADVAKGASKLAAGATATATGASRAAAAGKDLAAGAGQVADGVDDTVSGVGALASQLPALEASLTPIGSYLAAQAEGGDAQAKDLLSGLESASGSLPGSATLSAMKANLATLDAGAHGVADGATTLDERLLQLAEGAEKVSGGAAKLAAGTSELSTGAGRLTAGTGTLANGASRLSGAAGRLATGTTALSAGAGRLATGTGTLANGASQLSGGTAKLATGTTALSAGAGRLATGTGTLANGASQLSGGTARLATGTTTLSAGAGRLATGTGTLANGASQLSGGAGKLADGTATLADGSTTLANGVTTVADGAGKLGSGTQKLTDALQDGAAQLPNDSAALRAQRARVISSPVSLGSTDAATAEGFGEGFAPFFIPLALFVGALITWLLLRPVPPRALATPASGWRAAFAGYLPALAIGVGQVAIMLSVIHYGVGLEFSSVVGTVAFTVLIVAAFLALQQMLNALFGPAAGKVAILTLLMLQLASSGGTYPVETTPRFFRVIHPLLPMSYAVSGLREVITGGIDARLGASVAYLAGLLVLSLALTAWRAGRMRTWTLSRLHPVLAI